MPKTESLMRPLSPIHRQLALRVACIIGLCLPLIFYGRPLANLDSISEALGTALGLTLGEVDEMTGAAGRTVLLSLVSAFGAGSIALIAGLSAISRRMGLSRIGQVLLLVPFFLGEAVVGFVMRWGLDTQWGAIHTTELSPFVVLSMMVAIQALRFGGLFAFVIASQCALLDRSRIDFALAHGLGRGYLVRDSVLPRLMNTFQVCCCLAFAASMLENTIAMTVFRASSGNGLELLSHWTTRQFNLMSKSSPQLARDLVTVLAGLEFAATLLLGTLVFVLARPIALSISKLLLEKKGTLLRPRWPEIGALRVLQLYAGLLLGALAIVICLYCGDFDNETARALIPFVATFFLGGFAGFIAAALASFLAILCSLAWPANFAGLTRVSTAVLTAAVLLSAMPSAFVLLAVYDWILAVLRSQYGVGAWLGGHVITVLPLLFGFFLIAHFSVRSTEMDFQLVHRVRVLFVVDRSFARRYLATYVLGGFCAFALIWNDYTINSALSASVPSFASALDMALEGRSSSKTMAAACSMFSLVIGLACALGLSKRRPLPRGESL